MKVLALDIGNSKTAAGVLDAGRVVGWYRTEGSIEGPKAELSHRLTEVYDWCVEQIDAANLPGIVVASVVPALSAIWLELWSSSARTREMPCRFVDHRADFPFLVEVQTPETVGADRYGNVAAAVDRGLASALVVDLGTANTYDVLLEGRFLGGMIGPGIVASHRSLLGAGAQLPQIDFVAAPESEVPLIGRSTHDAILAGSYYQWVGGVRYAVQQLLAEVGDIPVLLTGGVAAEIEGSLGLRAEFVAELTLEGTASLYDRCQDAREAAG